MLDWRLLLGFVFASAIFGVAWLYLAALVFSWIARLVGGRASSLELRAVLAWSTAPSILGFIVILILLAGLRVFGSESAAATGGFSLLLPAIVVVCGLWSLVVLLLMLSRVEQFGLWRALTVYVLSLFLPLAAALLFRTFLFQPFNIPARSMAPTLLVGDYFFVAKYPYGYTHFSKA